MEESCLLLPVAGGNSKFSALTRRQMAGIGKSPVARFLYSQARIQGGSDQSFSHMAREISFNYTDALGKIIFLSTPHVKCVFCPIINHAIKPLRFAQNIFYSPQLSLLMRLHKILPVVVTLKCKEAVSNFFQGCGLSLRVHGRMTRIGCQGT